MCAWTAARTWTTGEVVTAAILNAHVRDNLLETSPAKVTTAGDILVATGANALKRLGVGSAEYTLRVNAGGTDVEWSAKSIFTGTDAGKGAAATASRIWVATDTQKIYYDTGAAWVEIGRAAGQIGAGDLGFDPATQDELNTHTATADAHHSRYTDVEAVTSMGVKANSNALNHDRYTDAEALAAARAGVVSGTWADSSTSITALGTYTKNIALGFSATKGRLFAKGSANLGHVFGAILAFNTVAANTHGLISCYRGGGVPSGNVHIHGAGTGIISLDADASDEQFGPKISLDSVRINGTNLELIFKNWDGSAQTIDVDLYWEVE